MQAEHLLERIRKDIRENAGVMLQKDEAKILVERVDRLEFLASRFLEAALKAKVDINLLIIDSKVA